MPPVKMIDQESMREALLAILNHPKSQNWGVTKEILNALTSSDSPIAQIRFNNIAKVALRYDHGEFTQQQRELIESQIN